MSGDLKNLFSRRSMTCEHEMELRDDILSLTLLPEIEGIHAMIPSASLGAGVCDGAAASDNHDDTEMSRVSCKMLGWEEEEDQSRPLYIQA